MRKSGCEKKKDQDVTRVYPVTLSLTLVKGGPVERAFIIGIWEMEIVDRISWLIEKEVNLVAFLDLGIGDL
ncbi:uncharacterized protein EAF01_010436 [Botrytis porri]|uniref:uncharacterized protein n=1 Tax=Botrytis porri TaxID=87229 RepID=UPI001900CD2D|nr:uncharacterized protein EAF01_010436 [Botrytis porri]KAF7892356.1 hypothetical protein EAF01_010436 [Botrytis porri]